MHPFSISTTSELGVKSLGGRVLTRRIGRFSSPCHGLVTVSHFESIIAKSFSSSATGLFMVALSE